VPSYNDITKNIRS